jgi:gluconate 2-dehydrogenase gamma chain
MSKTEEPRQDVANGVAEEKPQILISRRNFLKIATATVAVTAVGCDVAPPAPTGLPAFRPPVAAQYPEVPYAPLVPPAPGQLRFFTPHEARTVEAFTARLLPGTPQDPGAREAGVVYYVDHMLSHEEGFVEPVYRQGPFAES